MADLFTLPQAGPAQQDFEWGGLSVSQIFFFFWRGGGGGGVGGAEACYPGKIRLLVYSQISEGGFNISKQCAKAQCFYNLKQQRTANNNGANAPGSTRDYCNLFQLALFRFATPR